MITGYYRPGTLEEALNLLSSKDVVPLGGGTLLSKSRPESIVVVDLQLLGLNKIHKVGNYLEIGATATLQALLESPDAVEAIKSSLNLEIPINLRNMATVAGNIVTCNGRSPFAAVLLSMDAKIELRGFYVPSSEIPFGDLLINKRKPLGGKLITKIRIPIQIKTAFDYVARTPGDTPIIHTAMSRWSSGRTRLVVGGWGDAPRVAFDGPEISGIEMASKNAAHDANDDWASANYRKNIAVILANRCLNRLVSSQ